jgi:Tfp pilus assembly protein PilX
MSRVPRMPSRQRGVTLIVGMIMLILITLMVTTAFTLNTSNLKSVGNMQFRNESVAAANKAIEQVIGNSFPLGFVTVPPATTVTYDINNDGTTDYTVSVAQPVCLEATQVAGSGGSGACSGVRGGALAGCATPNFSTLWEVQANVNDPVSGSNVTVREGVRMELSQSQKNAVCP